jgi:hypothetical protein
MRDLHSSGIERRPLEATLELSEDVGPASPNGHNLDEQIRTVRREQRVAGMAVMLLDAAKVIKPVADLLSDRALVWATFASLVGLSAYAIRQPSWERLAVVGVFAIVVPWVIRAGRR